MIAVVSLAPVPIAAQAQTAPADTSTPPRTAWGVPDLRGIWDYRTLTPLQRPRDLAQKKFLQKRKRLHWKSEQLKGALLITTDRQASGCGFRIIGIGAQSS